MIQWLKKKFETMVLSERSSSTLAASFCTGTFIALTPSIPFQTPLIFLTSWLFSLNTSVNFAAVYLVNNPLTMIPIYIIDYTLGAWFFNRLLGISLVQYNPYWVERFNVFISRYIDIRGYLGNDFCIWYLLFGGIIFALIVTLPLYPLLKLMFERLITQIEKQKTGEHKSV